VQLKPNTQLREEIGQWRQSHLNGSLINGVDAANREMEVRGKFNVLDEAMRLRDKRMLQMHF